MFRHPLPQTSLHTSRTRNMVLLYCALYTLDACGQNKMSCVFSIRIYTVGHLEQLETCDIAKCGELELSYKIDLKEELEE